VSRSKCKRRSEDLAKAREPLLLTYYLLSLRRQRNIHTVYRKVQYSTVQYFVVTGEVSLLTNIVVHMCFITL